MRARNPYGQYLDCQAVTFELDTPLTKLQKDYLIKFVNKHQRIKRFYEKSIIKSDFAIRALGLPPASEFYFASRPVGQMPTWSTYWHKLLFSPIFRKIVLTLLCMQKYHFKQIDKHIFLKIIEITAPKDLTHYAYPSPFMNDPNVTLDPILSIRFDKLPKKCKSCGKVRECNYMSQHLETTDITPYTRPGGTVEIRFSSEHVYSNFELIVTYHLAETWTKYIEETFLARWKIKRIKCVSLADTDSDDTDDD